MQEAVDLVVSKQDPDDQVEDGQHIQWKISWLISRRRVSPANGALWRTSESENSQTGALIFLGLRCLNTKEERR